MKKTFIFDLGGVFVDWNPRYFYKAIFNDDAKIKPADAIFSYGHILVVYRLNISALMTYKLYKLNSLLLTTPIKS